MYNKAKALLIGEMMVDNTAPVVIARKPRTLYRRAEPTIYEQEQEDINALGGVFYLGRFLQQFMPVEVIFPMPSKRDFLYPILEEKLFPILEQQQQNIKSVPVLVEGRRPYRAKRFVETFEIDDDHQWAGGHAFMRVDYGDANRMTAVESDKVLERVRTVISLGNIDRVLLADYDLGLFTPKFIEGLKTILPSNIPITIYSGRKWQKYATLSNCSIVTDTNEAIAEVAEIEDLNGQENIMKRVFSEYILSNYPDVTNFVLVDSRSTTVIPRYSEEQSSSSNIYSLYTKFKNPRTPVGHRALIAAYLCYKINSTRNPCEWLLLAHEAAKCNGAVLIDKFNKDMANSIGQNPDPLKVETVKIPPPERLYYRLHLNEYILDLKEQSTGLPGIYTTDKELKESIQSILGDLRNETMPTSLFDPSTGHFVQKLLVQGPSGSGKSTIAESIAQVLGEDTDCVFHCNDAKLPNKPEEIVKKIVNFIRDKKEVVILDEIDKIKGKGKDVQKLLLTYFESRSTTAPSVASKKKSVVILTCSTEIEALKKNSNYNLADFYTRFPRRLEVPNLKNRPLDSAYAFSFALLKKGVNRISLQGLIAVVERQNENFRQVADLVERVVSNASNKDTVDDDACADAGLKPQWREAETNINVFIEGESELPPTIRRDLPGMPARP